MPHTTHNLSHIAYGDKYFLFKTEYLNYIGVNDAWMGILVASYGIAAMICSPIYGRFTDYYKMSRYVVMIASIFSLLGHCTLIMFRSEYGILIGKIFIGFGMSCDGSILGQVGRKDRVPVARSDASTDGRATADDLNPTKRFHRREDLVRLHLALLFVNSV